MAINGERPPLMHSKCTQAPARHPTGLPYALTAFTEYQDPLADRKRTASTEYRYRRLPPHWI